MHYKPLKAVVAATLGHVFVDDQYPLLELAQSVDASLKTVLVSDSSQKGWPSVAKTLRKIVATAHDQAAAHEQAAAQIRVEPAPRLFAPFLLRIGSERWHLPKDWMTIY